MMFYDGFVGGFNQAIYGNAIRVLGANIQVHAKGYSQHVGQKPLLVIENAGEVVQAAQAQPEVLAATQRINTTGLASSRAGAFAVGITGIEPEAELPVSLIAQHVSAGRFLSASDQDLEGVIMGLLGVAFGLALGLLLNGVIARVGFDMAGFTGLTDYTALIEGKVYTTLGLD